MDRGFSPSGQQVLKNSGLVGLFVVIAQCKVLRASSWGRIQQFQLLGTSLSKIVYRGSCCNQVQDKETEGQILGDPR